MGLRLTLMGLGEEELVAFFEVFAVSFLRG